MSYSPEKNVARGIYKIINAINNKFYVGSAVDFKRRWINHRHRLRNGKHGNKHLLAAWNKYGEDKFIFVVVEEVPDDADLLAAENRWLKDCVGKENCYNIAKDAKAAGLGAFGELNPMYGKTFSHTDEAKEKIRRASTGRKHSERAKEKIAEYLTGKPKPIEIREKISKTLSGEGNYWYGKKRDGSFVKKVSHPIIVTHPDETTTEYASIKILRETLGLAPPTINRALKSGAPLKKGKYKNWVFNRLGFTTVQTDLADVAETVR
jgi:group I intron endonuclease